jgi:hypothetical protein
MRDIKTILEENKDNLKVSMYWDYNDSLSNEQIMKIIKDEDGLNDIENYLIDNNLDYLSDLQHDLLKDILTEEEFENDDLRQEMFENIQIDLNLNDLIKNSSIRLRLTLLTNEDLIDLQEGEKNDTIKQFKKRFKGVYKRQELLREINEHMGSNYSHFVFYFVVKGMDILRFREEYQKGQIELRKGLNFGLFNSWSGCGSILEMKTYKPTTLILQDWRATNINDLVLDKLENKKSYYAVKVEDDKNKYGIDETYNLSSEGWAVW